MAKTKTLGIRLAPELIAELDELKRIFSFASYGEMIETLLHLLGGMDECVSRFEGHPRGWSAEDVRKCLALDIEHAAAYHKTVTALLWRRFKERFGQDGLEHLQQLLEHDSLATRAGRGSKQKAVQSDERGTQH